MSHQDCASCGSLREDSVVARQRSHCLSASAPLGRLTLCPDRTQQNPGAAVFQRPRAQLQDADIPFARQVLQVAPGCGALAPEPFRRRTLLPLAPRRSTGTDVHPGRVHRAALRHAPAQLRRDAEDHEDTHFRRDRGEASSGTLGRRCRRFGRCRCSTVSIRRRGEPLAVPGSTRATCGGLFGGLSGITWYGVEIFRCVNSA